MGSNTVYQCIDGIEHRGQCYNAAVRERHPLHLCGQTTFIKALEREEPEECNRDRIARLALSQGCPYSSSSVSRPALNLGNLV
ncbi:uncharacterized protein A1O9_07402 [Exophiala aquamarina CBS 119918]|uniref:Uncharacterized protein n=1 Tax=Exophiala aquamarina CBS 119918 TaxID=1182545 RepID=A0A072PBS1_9EURO|nr:uncharacterized protein A1O9_07402 [Exophiala aquamarina CBS 119918]KEF57212.1 hypothetical protein A1O9_07402 [Exophiala aquamarina CBS 119918]